VMYWVRPGFFPFQQKWILLFSVMSDACIQYLC
jgi:hypothetical protein